MTTAHVNDRPCSRLSPKPLDWGDKDKAMKSKRRPGRPNSITEKQADKMEAMLKTMVKKANAQEEITVGMLATRCGIEACDQTVLDKLHERNIWIRKLRSKPLLTDDDIKDRYQFSKD